MPPLDNRGTAPPIIHSLLTIADVAAVVYNAGLI